MTLSDLEKRDAMSQIFGISPQLRSHGSTKNDRNRHDKTLGENHDRIPMGGPQCPP